ncbi:MAG: hypothetical protein ACUVQ0_03880 [Thermoproteota archaeon]
MKNDVIMEKSRINVSKIVDRGFTSDYVVDHWEVNRNSRGSSLELDVEAGSPKEVRLI